MRRRSLARREEWSRRIGTRVVGRGGRASLGKRVIRGAGLDRRSHGGRGGAAARGLRDQARGRGGGGGSGGRPDRAQPLPCGHQGRRFWRTGYTRRSSRGARAQRGGEESMTPPLIAVTMGDPAGIGPEIIARTFDEGDFRKENRAIVVGDAGILQRAARLLDLPLRTNVVADPEDAAFEPGTIDVISETDLPEDLPFGGLDAKTGDAAFRYVELATGLASAGRVSAIATAPLNKEAMHLAGHTYPGHTEILAELTGTKDYAMMLVTDELKVIHVSTHVSLEEAIDATGPHPPDTVMLRARTGAFDIVVVQYHDQGHIPIKLMGFDTGVNVTVG